MTHASGVVVVGSINTDMTAYLPRFPNAGETVLGEKATLMLGGKGANQALAVARSGVRSYMVGCVGNDVLGARAISDLRADKVDTAWVAQTNVSTGVAHILVGPEGVNRIVVVPLANRELQNRLVERALRATAKVANVLTVQLEIPTIAAITAIRRAHALGMMVIVDTAPAISLPDDIWSNIDVVTPNAVEASAYSGVQVTDEKSAGTAGKWFCKKGAGAAIVTLAERGCVIATRASTRHIKPFHVTAVDTTGAGDAFTGYLASVLSRGGSLDDALLAANAAGALATTQVGSSATIPAAAAVQELVHAVR